MTPARRPVRLNRLWLIGALLLIAVSALGLQRAASERFVVAWDHHRQRPVLLRFGAKERAGHCVAQETDDPTSDILANIVDIDGDGRADLRFTANFQGDMMTCELRRAGFWFDADRTECEKAMIVCLL